MPEDPGEKALGTGRPGRILIVEDEFIIALAAEEALVEHGFQIVGVAASFEAAIALAERERPDLVLMDIRLASARDGVDAALELRKRFDLASLFTSANADPQNITRAEPSRPAGWLPKPYAAESLVKAVRQALS
jgi:two-component system, response regulator PdtaR